MSAFLGPIHYWLYNKIQFQEKFTQVVLKEGWVSSKEVDNACGLADLRPLEEIIDGGNIHGWLQDKIGVIEKRLAFLVTNSLKEDPSRITRLEEIAYNFGKENPMENGISAGAAFKFLEDTMLNGMPCDRVNSVLETSENLVSWKQNVCIHQQHWDSVEGDIALYYKLREKVIEGMFAQSGLNFSSIDGGEFEIRRN